MVMFSLISMDIFQLEAAQAGYLMSFFGVPQMVSGCWAHRVGGAPCPPRVLWAVGLCWAPRTSQTTGTRLSAAQAPSRAPASRALHPPLSFWLALLSLLAAPTPGSVCPPICPEVRLRGERGDSSAVEAGEPLASHWETRRRPMVRRVSIWAPAVDRPGRGQTPVVGRVTRRMAGLCVPPACPPVA